MNNTIKPNTVATATALVLLLGMGSSSAQTPDGDTPAEETVCDQLIGGTPGLYGLCVAYCEAQDHSDALPGEPPAWKILDVYNKRRKAGDPEMPCLQAPCPCWSEDDLDIAIPTVNSCIDFDGDPGLQVDELSISGPAPGDANNARVFRFNDDPTFDKCFFIVQQQGLPNSGLRREFLISKEESASCEASIRHHAESLGFVCVAP